MIAIVIQIAVLPVWSEKLLIVADEWPQMEILTEFLQEQGGYAVEKVEQNDLPGDLSSYRGVFQFVHGALQDRTSRVLIDYTRNGGRAIVLHHGISYRKMQTEGWPEFLGIKLDNREEAEPRYVWIHDIDFTLVNLNANHYITTNKITYPKTIEYKSSDQPSAATEFPAIEFKNTEVFLNHQFTDGREKTVLFGFYFKDPKTGKVWMQDRSGWYKPYGRGWVFYFHPGHTVEDFKTPNYCQIILNSLTWKP